VPTRKLTTRAARTSSTPRPKCGPPLRLRANDDGRHRAGRRSLPADAFADEGAIFDDVITGLVDAELAYIRTGMRRRSGLPAQLRYACRQWTLTDYEIVLANPDASELFDDRFAAVRSGHAAFEMLLAELLAAALGSADLRAPAADLARMLSSAVQGFKQGATTKAELDRLLDSCPCVTLAALSA
jgi:hypothetical protein